MFDATERALFLEYFRVPYRIVEPDLPPDRGVLAPAGGGSERRLVWPTRAALAARGVRPTAVRLGTIPVFAAVTADETIGEWLGEAGAWRELVPLVDGRGRRVAAVWRDDETGSFFLPFDPAEAIEAYWSEAYKLVAGATRARIRSLAGAGYYRVRPVLPRALQITIRRAVSRVQARASFPRWPLETGLHDLYAFLFAVLGQVGQEPIPWIAPWPNGFSWALVLTHDVETRGGYDQLDLLREIEVKRGRRSSWNFVPGRYAVDDEVVKRLTDDGFEVGVHGVFHDGRDVAPAFVDARRPAMAAAAERWNAKGFRAPATRRVWDVMPTLGFDYDSSYPDTDPFEPDGGGCCTWLPFLNGDTVELPITLPQDHTLFRILRHRDESLWLEKTEELRRRGGLALLITHPDYMLDAPERDAYRRYLDATSDDPTAWSALPRDVSAWWRRRAASHLERIGGHWQIVGPAAGEGRVAFAPVYSSTQ